MFKNHISWKTGLGFPATLRTSFPLWFQACHRVLPQACLLQHPRHLQGRKLIILRLPQARPPHHPWHLQPCQAKVWLDKNGETRAGLITIPQLCQVNMLKGKNGETRALLKSRKSSCWLSQPKIPNQIKMRITMKNGETRCTPTYRNGCESSGKMLWMTEFLNAEPLTPVLFMSYLQSPYSRDVRIWVNTVFILIPLRPKLRDL